MSRRRTHAVVALALAAGVGPVAGMAGVAGAAGTRTVALKEIAFSPARLHVSKGTTVLSAAGTIATVEARHAAWIRFINGATPAPADFDKPKSEKAILKAVGATGFIR